jgi:hypothetical protein
MAIFTDPDLQGLIFSEPAAQGGYDPKQDTSNELDLSFLKGEPEQAPRKPTAEFTGKVGSSPYDAEFSRAEKKYGLPVGILKSIAAVESNFNPNAISSAGAIGLMQFIPDTAKRYGIDPKDPAQSIDGAARLLKDNLKMFDGDLPSAVAAYNAGPRHAKLVNEGKAKPFAETADYVSKVFQALGATSQGEESPAETGAVGKSGVQDPMDRNVSLAIDRAAQRKAEEEKMPWANKSDIKPLDYLAEAKNTAKIVRENGLT